MLLDHFILTFKHNALPVVVVDNKPAKWLDELTYGEAEFIGKTKEGYEIAIPVSTFLLAKDKVAFQYRCRNLVRLRTTPITPLCYLVHPINQIDNRL